jgi:hypothetical protein
MHMHMHMEACRRAQEGLEAERSSRRRVMESGFRVGRPVIRRMGPANSEPQRHVAITRPDTKKARASHAAGRRPLARCFTWRQAASNHHGKLSNGDASRFRIAGQGPSGGTGER